MTEPAVGHWYLGDSGGWLLCHLPPVALLTLPAPDVDVLVHGLPDKSAGDVATGRPCPWMSNVMQSSEDASAMVRGNDGPCHTSRDVTQDVSTPQGQGPEL